MKFNYLIMSFIITCSLLAGSLYFHEQIHIMNNKKVGIESNMVFGIYDGWLPSIGVEKTGYPQRDLTNYEMIHLQNEIINYNITPLLFGIMILIIMGFTYLGEKK